MNESFETRLLLERKTLKSLQQRQNLSSVVRLTLQLGAFFLCVWLVTQRTISSGRGLSHGCTRLGITDPGIMSAPDLLSPWPKTFNPWLSMAINLYLAKTYGGDLYPSDAAKEAQTWQWSVWMITVASGVGYGCL